MNNTIESIYVSSDYIKKSERKKLIKQIIESGDERMVDCYEYFNNMYTAISISSHHLVWTYDIDFSGENVVYSINIMSRNYND